MRSYRKFSWKGATYNICTPFTNTIINEIKKQRKLLETYINKHPDFVSSLNPISLLPNAPQVALRMQIASKKTGVGPMAAVAGAIAQAAAQAALTKGACEAIVENGGDIYLYSNKEATVGLYAGQNMISAKLGVVINPENMPLSICSSSSAMGHSLSLGNCDLATVVSKDAALADAAATLACNLVKKAEDLNKTLEKIMKIQGILGILIVKEKHVGIAGDFPRLIRV